MDRNCLCKIYFPCMPKQFGIAIKIYYVYIFILNNSAIWLVNTKPQNSQIHCRFSLRKTCNPCGNTMKTSSRYHVLLSYDVKRTTKIDGMGPFKTNVLFRSPETFKTWPPSYSVTVG